MNVKVILPANYARDHFTLTVIKKSDPAELSNQDREALHEVLRRSRRTAKRLSVLDAKTES